MYGASFSGGRAGAKDFLLLFASLKQKKKKKKYRSGRRRKRAHSLDGAPINHCCDGAKYLYIPKDGSKVSLTKSSMPCNFTPSFRRLGSGIFFVPYIPAMLYSLNMMSRSGTPVVGRTVYVQSLPVTIPHQLTAAKLDFREESVRRYLS